MTHSSSLFYAPAELVTVDTARRRKRRDPRQQKRSRAIAGVFDIARDQSFVTVEENAPFTVLATSRLSWAETIVPPATALTPVALRTIVLSET